MNELTIFDQKWISAKELHLKLNVGRDFSSWIKGRIADYEFVEGKDYHLAEPGKMIIRPQVEFDSPILVNQRGGDRRSIDYMLTVGMAKELAIVENNEQGRAIRQYLIKLEEAWNNPEMLQKRLDYLAGSKRPMLESVRNELETLKIKKEKEETRADLPLAQFILENFRITGLEKNKISVKTAYSLYCSYAEHPQTAKEFTTNVCFSYPEVCLWKGNLTGLKRVKPQKA
jgi:phage anti-repressor protein